MPLDHEKMVNFEYPESEHSYTEQDTILYALSVGLGAEPNNPDQLKFVYEKDLQALPMMAGILGWLGRRPDPGFGVNLKKVVAGEQKIILHKPLPTSATFISRSKISDVLDKGERTGALIYYERDYAITRDIKIHRNDRRLWWSDVFNNNSFLCIIEVIWKIIFF